MCKQEPTGAGKALSEGSLHLLCRRHRYEALTRKSEKNDRTRKARKECTDEPVVIGEYIVQGTARGRPGDGRTDTHTLSLFSLCEQWHDALYHLAMSLGVVCVITAWLAQT